LNDEVELPPYIYGREAGPNEKVWAEDAVRAAVLAEREKCAQIAESQPRCNPVDAELIAAAIRKAQP
jgi:hypothetical protein